VRPRVGKHRVHILLTDKNRSVNPGACETYAPSCSVHLHNCCVSVCPHLLPADTLSGGACEKLIFPPQWAATEMVNAYPPVWTLIVNAHPVDLQLIKAEIANLQTLIERCTL